MTTGTGGGSDQTPKPVTDLDENATHLGPVEEFVGEVDPSGFGFCEI